MQQLKGKKHANFYSTVTPGRHSATGNRSWISCPATPFRFKPEMRMSEAQPELNSGKSDLPAGLPGFPIFWISPCYSLESDSKGNYCNLQLRNAAHASIVLFFLFMLVPSSGILASGESFPVHFANLNVLTCREFQDLLRKSTSEILLPPANTRPSSQRSEADTTRKLVA